MSSLEPFKLELGDDPTATGWVKDLRTQVNRLSDNVRRALKGTNQQVKDIVFTAPQPTWRTGLSGTWVDFGGSDTVSGYRIDNRGRGHLKGLVKNGAAAPSTIIAMPADFAPTGREIFVVPTSAGVKGEVHILSSGVVSLDAGNVGYVSLAGITWQAATPPFQDLPTWAQGAPEVGHTLPKVVGVSAISCLALDVTRNYSAGATQPVWEAAGPSSIRITDVPGLTPGKRYAMRVLLIGG